MSDWLVTLFDVKSSADYRLLAPQIIAALPRDVLAQRISSAISDGTADQALNAAELPYYLSGAGLMLEHDELVAIDRARHVRLRDVSLTQRTRMALTRMVLPGYG